MPTGAKILQLAESRIGSPYVFGCLAPKNDSGWKKCFDCAEFVSWCIYQVSGRLYGCDNNHGNPALADAYTGFWKRDALTLGRQIDVDAATATPGAAILRFGSTSKVGHIVISDGSGGTVEAMGKAYGVCRGQVAGRRWDMGIMVPWIDYQVRDIQPIPGPGKIYRLTSPYMKEDLIKAVQMALYRSGFDPGSWDAVYGPRTFNSVCEFQRAKGLVVDGEVGPQTLRALGLGG